MVNEPLVSFLMTAFNRQDFVAEAIQSVIDCGFEDWELIVTDDVSTDNTFSVIKKIAGLDNRIKVFSNEKRLGDYANRNRAASYASGYYIHYIDSDDKLLPGTTVKLLSIMRKNPNCMLAMHWKHDSSCFAMDGASALRTHFFTKQFLYIGPGGTFMQRDFFNSIGGYPEIYGPANDMYFNLKICCYTSIMLVPFEFVYYRIHAGQEINNTFSYLHNNYNYMKDAINQLPLPLSKKEKNWLLKKNKRRFLVNAAVFLKLTFNFRLLYQLFKRSQFSFKDALEGLFHR